MRATGTKRWVDAAKVVVSDYNSQLIPNTQIVRSSVSKQNYMSLLEELFKTDEPTGLMNIANQSTFPSPIAKLLFRYSVGDWVLLARRADYTLKDKSVFEKPSERGSFGPREYQIIDRRIKQSANYFITPVYALTSKQTGRLSSYFYDTEVSVKKLNTICL